MIDRKKFDKAKRFLRRKYPIPNVRVIFTPRTKLREDWKPRVDHEICGDFEYVEDGRYIIRISAHLTTREVLKTLCHEWAHVQQHAKGLPCNSDHDRVFKALEAYLTEELLTYCR